MNENKTEKRGALKGRVQASKTDAKSRLFLIEFISALAVFCVAAGVCAGVLALAYKQSREAAALDGAVFACASCADAYKAAKGDAAVCAALCGGTAAGGAIELWYDGDWNACEKDGAAYTVRALCGGGRLRQARITAYDADGAALFSVTAAALAEDGE